jgi:hypothetical protein
LGTDGLLHYTEAHHDIFHHNTNKTGSPEFCIELESKNDEDFSNPEGPKHFISLSALANFRGTRVRNQ